MADVKKPIKAAAAPAKKKAVSGIFQLYEKSGETLVRKNPSCPKCGPGFFMGKHNNRLYCGACHYTEFKTIEKPAEKK